MKTSVKLNLLFQDRVGIIADVSDVLAQADFNIISMEVERRDNTAEIYLEAESGGALRGKSSVFEILKDIKDLQSIKFVKTLPAQRRENLFRIILDNVSDGIISIDKDHRITTINSVAKRIFCHDGKEIEGEQFNANMISDSTLLECLDNKSVSNEKRSIITKKGRFRFFVTGKPLIDSSGKVVGAVEIIKDMKEINQLAQEVSLPVQISFSDFLGKSPTINDVVSFAQKIAPSDSIVSIRGESGTGKELLARAIHTESRRKGPFVPLNCAAMPEALLESELFGYVDGAFTGARKGGKPGLFEVARGGTLFLDEIADMPLITQAKILRVIQDKVIRRIGGTREFPVDTRIITATNQNLEQLMENHAFREDLYYRINVLPIHIPPLRERAEDIPLLVEHFLFHIASRLGETAKSIHDAALRKLSTHNWPGNVRELRNVIERAVFFSNGSCIGAEHILFGYEVETYTGGVKPDNVNLVPGGGSLQELLGHYEKKIIEEMIAQSGSIRKAARSLGISHTTLLNKMKKHEISSNRS